MWDLRTLCEIASAALRERALAIEEEQSPYGLDALDELGLHPLLRDGFASAGFGVHAEMRFPGGQSRGKRSEGERCDLVLTEDPDARLMDAGVWGPLFGGAGARVDEAMWIEVKTVHQYALVDGMACANTRYSSQLLGGASADLKKLARDEAIVHGAVCLVMFNADKETAEHDLMAWAHRCVDRGLLASSPVSEGFSLSDRLGNRRCTVAFAAAVRARTENARSAAVL